MSRIHDVFHISLLKPYHSDGTVQPPPPIEIDGELEYEVEKILMHRSVKIGRKTTTEYLIKWQGYEVEHNSWEPESALLNSQSKLQEYWAAQSAIANQATVETDDDRPRPKRRRKK
jgi:hypothetical protein